MLKDFYYQEVKCTSEKDDRVVTQPNLSRTIRQILADTAAGKPSPVPLTPAPNDSEVARDKDLHKIRIAEDKFDAINSHRDYINKVQAKVSDNKKKLAKAEQEAKNASIKEAETRGYARGIANSREDDK